MTSASFTVLYMKVQLEWHSIIFCSLGALFSIVIGLEYVDDLLTCKSFKYSFLKIFTNIL